MNPLLEQFLSEARDFLEDIGQTVLQLEEAPDDAELLGGLFRLVHTLKGNSGLFEFAPLTRVVHAAEDLLDKVRSGQLALDADLTDLLLSAMDFVSELLDTIAEKGALDDSFVPRQQTLETQLRARIPVDSDDALSNATDSPASTVPVPSDWSWVGRIPESTRAALLEPSGSTEWLAVRYVPEPECFFKGEDPLLTVQHLPGLQALAIHPLQPWPPSTEVDVYQANLVLDMLTSASLAEVSDHFRYVPEQIVTYRLPALALAVPVGAPSGDLVYSDLMEEAQARLQNHDMAGVLAAASALLEMVNPGLWIASALRWVQRLAQAQAAPAAIAALLAGLDRQTSPDWHAVCATLVPQAPPPTPPAVVPTVPASVQHDPLSAPDQAALVQIVATQRHLMDLPVAPELWAGRLDSIGTTLNHLYQHLDGGAWLPQLQQAIAAANDARNMAPLAAFVDAHPPYGPTPAAEQPTVAAPPPPAPAPMPQAKPAAVAEHPKAPVRNDDNHAAPVVHLLKVPMEKVDRLMDLIGEMVVAKNALPYLADRAEKVFGSRELAREIKTQYAVINRIAEEMQDGIMQVRMLPLSAVFQRFPRLVRDVAKNLGKQVHLVVEGDDTEADKNIVEALGDPLIHILRNSLDHGIESPEVRQAAGKPAQSTLSVSARQEGDRVLITVQDDGKGIDPETIKIKAFEKGLIDEARLETLTEAEAVQLVFAAGFSTAEAITDLSGRGVGMDVVRNSISKMGGSVQLSSQKGLGTRLELSLPLSVTVSNVMMITLAGQRFGVPMDVVVETVRIHPGQIHQIKNQRATVLRNELVPLFGADALLGLPHPPQPNEHGEYAVLLVRVLGDIMGLIVDGFAQTVDIILKPLEGPLAGLPGFAGTALLGDGSVLLVLDMKELI